MDPKAFFDGSFEDALVLIEKTAEEARGGRIKTAEGILDTLKGYAGQAGDYATQQWGKFQPHLDTAQAGAQPYLDQAKPYYEQAKGWLGDQAKDPASAAMIGAGTGAGLGLLGSTVFGEPGRRRPGYGMLLGGLMGGAAGGGVGMWNQMNLKDKTRNELQADKEQQYRDAKIKREGIDNAIPGGKSSNPNAPVPYAALAGEAGNMAGDIASGLANSVPLPTSMGGRLPLPESMQGVNDVVSPYIPKFETGHESNRFGKPSDGGASASITGSALAADLMGRAKRYFMPTHKDIVAGLPTTTLPTGWTASDLVGRPDLSKLSRPGGGLPADLGSPEIQAPVYRPKLDPKAALPASVLTEAGQTGQGLRKGWGKSRFAGTPLSGKIVYPLAGAADYFLHRLPAVREGARADELAKGLAAGK